MYRNFKIVRFLKGDFLEVTDKVITEEEYELYINGKQEDTLNCSPANLQELVAGYLYEKSIINNKHNLNYLTINEQIINVNISEIICNKVENDVLSDNQSLEINPRGIFKIADLLTRNAELFRETGGAHNVLLCTAAGEEIIFREDISRNNAVNKVIGYILIEKIDPTDKVIAVSCRVSSIIISKIIKIGIPLVISVSAPTDKAVEMAANNDLTLLGFVKKNRMNIYTDNHNLIIK